MQESTKKIYIVRHGQTQYNVENKIQDLRDPLTEKGLAQAKALGERMRHVHFESVIASDALRAHSTADEIARASGHTVETNTLFRELPRPSSLHGIERTAPEAVKFYEAFAANQDNPDWRFEDEETFGEMRDRAIRALQFLAVRPEKTIVVVTHGNFKRALLGAILYGRELTSKDWRRMASVMSTSNTGVTLLEYAKNDWRVLTWNDHAHLAD